jgi:aldose 1-epimerase
MYFKLFLESLERKLGGRGSGGFLRSFTVTGLFIALFIVGATAAYIEHGRGNIQKIKKHLRTPAATDTGAMRPGGLDPVVLSRPQTPDTLQPEFLSATVLPGRGMNVLQISAFVPGLGVVNLIDSPSLESATQAMSGVDDDSEGQASLANGAPILLPWAGHLAGITSLDGKSASVTWKGQILNLPANSIETPLPTVYGGLLLNQPATSVQTDPSADGATTKAVFSAVDADDRWPSNLEATITLSLSGKAIDMTVDVKNTGDSVLPVGIGWSPRFRVAGGDRSKVTLHLPATLRSEQRGANSGMPNGILSSVTHTPYDFTAREGSPLGDRNFNDTLVELRPVSGASAAIELRDPLAKFGLRMIPLSSTIKAIHVLSPPGASFVSLSPQMNFDDPWGHQWPEDQDTGMAQLNPGQSTQWKIRLELFALTGANK